MAIAKVQDTKFQKQGPLAPPQRPAAEQPDAGLRQDLARQIHETMEPSQGGPEAIGVVGFMYRNGLRRNDRWRDLVKKEEVGAVEAKLKEIGQRLGVDMLDAKARNGVIDHIFTLHCKGCLQNLPADKLQKLLGVSKALKELAEFITPRRIRPIGLGDYNASEFHAAFAFSNFSNNRENSYISPIGMKISESASRRRFSSDYNGWCLRGVRLTLEGANAANDERSAWAIHSVRRFRENEDFKEISGLTVSEIDKLPVGSVVVYHHPSDARRGRGIENARKPGHAQVKVLRPDGTTRWTSDTVQRDGTAYTMSPGQRAYVFVPRDYLDSQGPLANLPSIAMR